MRTFYLIKQIQKEKKKRNLSSSIDIFLILSLLENQRLASDTTPHVMNIITNCLKVRSSIIRARNVDIVLLAILNRDLQRRFMNESTYSNQTINHSILST